jgi:hypothetical protein
MTAHFCKLATIATLAAAALLAPVVAEAQTHAASLADQVAAGSVARPGPGGKWTCVSRAMVEIAPVSYDTTGGATAWVRVYRVKGEIVAAERVEKQEIEQLRRLPCGKPDSEDGGVALVG